MVVSDLIRCYEFIRNKIMNNLKKTKMKKEFKVNFDAAIQRVGQHRETGKEVIVKQSISNVIENQLRSLKTFTEVEVVEPLLEKAKEGGIQILDDMLFSVFYQSILRLSTSEKSQIKALLKETGIDIVEYEKTQK